MSCDYTFIAASKSARAFLATIAVAALFGVRFIDAQQPAFRAGVELIMIDVQVTPAKDAAIRELTVADFDVKISGRKRPAVSATLLHNDDGTVTTRDSRAAIGGPDCVFGFHRTTNKPTAHYAVAIEVSDVERKNLTAIRVNMADKAFAVQRYVWRAPIRRSAAGP